MQPREVFTKFKRRFSAEEKRSKKRSTQITDPEYLLIVADAELQRDFREFLISTGVPDLLGYFDFVLSCHMLRHVENHEELLTKAKVIYQRYMRSYATEKIQLDDFGASKRQVECDLDNKQPISPFIFDSAALQAYRKLKQPLVHFMRPLLNHWKKTTLTVSLETEIPPLNMSYFD